MEQTQAQGPAQAQVQQPVHPIHEEQATLARLTKLVSETPDNDPHEGTDMELPKKEEEAPPQEAQETPAEEEKFEIPEDEPLFEVPDLEDPKKTVRASLKELREQRMMKADYHRNIQKVKAQEAELATKAQQAAMQAQQEYLQRLEQHKQLMLKVVAPELQSVDLNKLAEQDPAEAQRIFFKQIQLNQSLQAIEAEQRAAVARQQESMRAAHMQAIEKARQTLESDIPGWNAELYNQVLGTVAKDYGFKNEEVAPVTDARLIKVFHDAAKYRQLQQAKPEISKKVVAVPKVIKPGSAEKPNPSGQVQELQDRLKKSGRPEDFVALQLAKQKLQKRK